MMEYKGYFGCVEYDDEARVFHGEVIGLRDVITFQGTSVDELEREFKLSVDEYYDFCNEEGREPECPCYGKISIKISPDIHVRLLVKAERAGKDFDDYVNDLLQKGADHL